MHKAQGEVASGVRVVWERGRVGRGVLALRTRYTLQSGDHAMVAVMFIAT